MIWAYAVVCRTARVPIPTAYASPSAAGYGGLVGSVLSPARNGEQARPQESPSSSPYLDNEPNKRVDLIKGNVTDHFVVYGGLQLQGPRFQGQYC